MYFNYIYQGKLIQKEMLSDNELNNLQTILKYFL